MRLFRHPLLNWLRQRRRLQPIDAPALATLPRLIHTIWRERPDLQHAFDLTTEPGRIGAFWWLYRHGFVELGLRPTRREDRDVWSVNRPVPSVPRRAFTPITWLMREVWLRTGPQPFPLRSAAGQNHLLTQFFAVDLDDWQLGALLTVPQARALRADDPQYPGTPRLFVLLHAAYPALQARFAGPADPAFAVWCRGEGRTVHPILAHRLVALTPGPPIPAPQRPHGVNLIGFAQSRFGIAEDVRMAARALIAAGTACSIYDISSATDGTRDAADGGAGGGAGDAVDEAAGLHDRIRADLPYATNIFCITAMSTITTMLAHPGRFDGYRNIGFWPWELPNWPHFWHHAFDFVDEVWAASAFTAAAYRHSSPKPVRHLPIAVSVEGTAGMARAAFGLPADRFLFAFAFDGQSSFMRKRPLAVIEAFAAAFPDPAAPVGLVIKGLRVADDPAWRAVCDLAARNPRIHLIDRSLPRGALLDLYRAVDCFVSLHRSEGFGRNIAEAMALGKPVIATGYSGNCDFTHADTAALVPFTLIPTRQGDYPFGAGQHWADADIDTAATLMRRMVADPAWRSALAIAGRDFVERQYALPVVGAAWAAALADR